MLSGTSDYIHGDHSSIGCSVPPIAWKEFMVALHAAVLVVGLLFITDFKLRKPKNATLVVLVVIVAAAVLKILHVCQ